MSQEIGRNQRVFDLLAASNNFILNNEDPTGQHCIVIKDSPSIDPSTEIRGVWLTPDGQKFLVTTAVEEIQTALIHLPPHSDTTLLSPEEQVTKQNCFASILKIQAILEARKKSRTTTEHAGNLLQKITTKAGLTKDREHIRTLLTPLNNLLTVYFPKEANTPEDSTANKKEVTPPTSPKADPKALDPTEATAPEEVSLKTDGKALALAPKEPPVHEEKVTTIQEPPVHGEKVTTIPNQKTSYNPLPFIRKKLFGSLGHPSITKPINANASVNPPSTRSSITKPINTDESVNPPSTRSSITKPINTDESVNPPSTRSSITKPINTDESVNPPSTQSPVRNSSSFGSCLSEEELKTTAQDQPPKKEAVTQSQIPDPLLESVKQSEPKKGSTATTVMHLFTFKIFRSKQ